MTMPESPALIRLRAPFHGKGVDGFLPLFPPSFGRRWRVAPEVGFTLFRLRPASPLPRKGENDFLLLLPPPLEGGSAAREVGFALFFLRTTPCPSGILPSIGRGEMGYSSHFSLLPLEGGGAAREVGFALFHLRTTPCPSGIPFHGKGAWYEMTGISTLSHCQIKKRTPHRSPPILPASIS